MRTPKNSERYFCLNTIFTDSLEVGFFSEIKIIIWAECVFSSSQVAPNVESFVVILLYFVQTQKVNCVWMTHCCRLGIRFMSILLGFNFCLHFTLPGIFSPQNLKSYLRLWHNQTIILTPDKSKSRTNKIFQIVLLVLVSIPWSLWSGSTQTE